MSAEENLKRLKTLDDAWNAQNWDVFRRRPLFYDHVGFLRQIGVL